MVKYKSNHDETETAQDDKLTFISEGKRKLKWWVLGLFGLITLDDSLYILDQTEQAVITQFGKPVKVYINPIKRNNEFINKLRNSYKENKEGSIKLSDKGAGIKIKLPYIQKINRFDRRIMEWDGYEEQIPTEDKKYLWINTTARWYIQDPLEFYRTVKDENTAQARLDDIIDASTRNVITNEPLIEIVRSSNRKMEVSEEELRNTVRVDSIKKGRDVLVNEITNLAQKQLIKYGIALIPDYGVVMKNVSYVDEVKLNIEARMISERERVAARYISEGEGEFNRIIGEKERELKKILSEAYKEAQGIRGAADATAVKITANAFGKSPDFYEFVRSLQLYEESLDSTTRLILNTNSRVFRTFNGK